MLRILSNSAESLNKPLASLLKHIQAKHPHKVWIDHPLKLQNYGGIKGLGILANKEILTKEKILSVSTTQAITGFEILDADQKTSSRLQEIAETIAKKYHENNQSQYYFTINLLKIIFQIEAQKSDSSLSVSEYANFLYDNYPKHVPLNWPKHVEQYSFSSHLKTLIDAQKTYIGAISGDLGRVGLPLLTFEELLKTISIVRSRTLNFLPHEPRKFTKDTVAILCPIVDLLNHSFDPNCKIDGFYNSFENDSFVEVRAIKDIKEGEELTINYGDMSNYDFFMRYGFLNQENPFGEFPLRLDFGDFIEYTAQAFDLKQKIFSLNPDFQLERVGIFKEKIDANMLATLRVYFLTDEDLKQNKEIFTYLPRDFKTKISDANERRIYQLIIQNITRELEALDSARNQVVNSVKLPGNVDKNIFYDVETLKANKDRIQDSNICNIIQVGLDEELILKKNLEFCNKQLKSLPK